MTAPRTLVLLVVLALVAAACGVGSPPARSGDAATIEIDRSPDVSAASEVAGAANALGFDLLRELDDGENVVVSPVSVSTLVAMILAGAGGVTAEEIAATLHLDPGDPRLERYADLLLVLGDVDDVTLAIANSLWAAEGVPLEDDYVGFVRPTFGATLEEADLGAQETADRIDAWVAERTEGLIDEFAEALGLPNAQAILVLLNAVYFKGAWADPFDPERTRPGQFERPDGTTVDAEFMTKDAEMAVAQGDGFSLVRLPYGDGRFGMELFLPDGDLGELVDRLDPAAWAEAVDAVGEQRIMLALPKMDLSYEAELNDPLSALGMEIAFGGGADFRPMSPTNPWVDVIAHETRLIVDEEGTEAAAVTGGVMVESAPPEMRFDRPFLFTISDRETGAILFLGAITDPTA